MADQIPETVLTFDDSLKPAVLIGDAEYSDWAHVIESVPGIQAPENAEPVARIMTHLTFKSRYTVIVDPALYEAEYLGRIEQEGEAGPFEQGVVRTRSFGVPDFTQIHAPQFEHGKLVYYVYDSALFVPYRVEAIPTDPDLTKPVYTPLPLQPAPDRTYDSPEVKDGPVPSTDDTDLSPQTGDANE